MKSLKILTLFSVFVVLLFCVSLAVAQESNTGDPAMEPVPLEAIPATDGAVSATVIGTGAPPAILEGFAMTPVPFPGAPGCTGVLPPLPTPLGPMGVSPTDGTVRCIGSGWASWSHGYLGDVYYTGGALSQTITLPPGTGAFYGYVEPNPFTVQTCQAVAFPGGVSTGPFPVDGSGGAVGFGFWDPAGGAISSVEVSCDTDFATGEYAVGPAGGVESVGGTLTGQTGVFVFCKNQRTGQSKFGIILGAESWDCEALGLVVNPGDKILQLIIGTAE